MTLICSRIVSEILSKKVRERLLREPELTLKKAIDMCQAEELSKEQLKFFDNNVEIPFLSKRKGKTEINEDNRA